jgi:hypothetical protein
MPYESFFGGNTGVLADDSQEHDPFATPGTVSSATQQHLDVLKSDHVKFVRSKNASKNFKKQLRKMTNCADEMRTRIHKSDKHSDVEDVTEGVDGSTAKSTQPLKVKDDDSIGATSKSDQSVVSNLSSGGGGSLLNLLAVEFVDSNR